MMFSHSQLPECVARDADYEKRLEEMDECWRLDAARWQQLWRELDGLLHAEWIEWETKSKFTRADHTVMSALCRLQELDNICNQFNDTVADDYADVLTQRADEFANIAAIRIAEEDGLQTKGFSARRLEALENEAEQRAEYARSVRRDAPWKLGTWRMEGRD